MKINKVWAVSFSPTRTSQKVVDGIVEGISGIENDSIDLTYPGYDGDRTFSPDELVVIGVPVYSGRVAGPAVKRLEQLRGSNTPIVLVVLYGNREYEDALLELKEIALKSSFIPVAGAAFIGEHSFSSAQAEIAAGRPDSVDLGSAASFGKSIMDKIEQAPDFNAFADLQVPGNTPFKDGMGPIPVTPGVDSELCTICGVCVESCPTGAITIDNEVIMDVDLCIFCCACIKTCPEQAVSITAPPIIEKQMALHKNCAARKEPELYYSAV